MFFLVKGAASYVLPRYGNKIYSIIEEGEYFGHVDLAGSDSFIDEDLSINWKPQSGKDLMRRFTV